MIKVGLTGGIGAGKSLACEIFAALGAPIVDADAICHDLTAPGGPCIAAVREAFGDAIVGADGALRRDRLRDIVFSDDARRKQLEDILHPAVREKMQNAVTVLHAPYCIMSVPLLIERGMQNLVDTVVVVDCPEAQRVERVAKRSGWDAATVRAVIEKQASREERLAAADIVIDNSGDRAAVKKQISSLHEMFIGQAANERT